ncbi:hypothetical protein KO495_09310 [Colwellia sp. D2M02]|uniref:hypothetical protein n=1 Tax=Colwellia sp. D2M02 TaxID=2841562 RepID=UPI001C0A025D|nr:hypothetical protein [Colwellia sp. D2M02]MBU2893514.1 hypothetical protein [Colwellia sp. D2M02]
MKNIIIILLALGLFTFGYLYFSKETINTTLASQNSKVEQNSSKLAPENKKVKAAKTTIAPAKEIAISHHTSEQEIIANSTGEKRPFVYAIPADIKEKICQKNTGNTTCAIDLDSQYATEIMTENGSLLSAEIHVILTSSNFNEILTDLSSNKISADFFENEATYNDELANLTAQLGISSNGISCGDTTCGLTVQGDNEEALKTFNKKFMNSKEKGNYFQLVQADDIHHRYESRILFFPGNTNSVIQRAR